MSQKEINDIAQKTLGINTGYPSRYDKKLLLAIPRNLNREGLNYDEDTLGVDLWRAFEVSCISKNGLPVIGILHFTVPSYSKFIVESKSLKLYLNSLSNLQLKTENTKEELLSIIVEDISFILECKINANIKTISENNELFRFPSDSFIDISNFVQDGVILQAIDSFEKTPIIDNQKLKSHWLKSRCRITDQPDWGNLYIEIKGKNGLCPKSLASFLIKNHDLNHFHEEMCELIYCKIMEEIKPDKLTVACLYTRRGGIDINPVRTNDGESKIFNFLSDNNMFLSTFRQ